MVNKPHVEGAYKCRSLCRASDVKFSSLNDFDRCCGNKGEGNYDFIKSEQTQA